jgi:crossover junction endodeoxyribonuclease RuvC
LSNQASSPAKRNVPGASGHSSRKLRILGVDPGSAVTGYGVIETDGNRHSLLDFGALKSPKSLSFPEKLLHIHTQLLEIIEHCRPDRMAVESLFYAANVKSALKLGHVRGVALVAGVSKGLPIDEYSPLEIKQSVVGYGRADKAQVQKMVALLLGLDAPPAPHDAADALAVALCHAHRLHFARKIADGETLRSKS